MKPLRKGEFAQIFGGFAMFLVILLGVFAAIQSIALSPLWGKDADGAGWIGAIGTVGTLIGTIWLATKQSREKRAQDLIAARLTAHENYFQYIHDEGNIAAGIATLRSALSEEPAPLSIAEIRKMIDLTIELLDKIQLQSASEIMPMTLLPSDCARRIASAQGRVRSSRKILSEVRVSITKHDMILQLIQYNVDILDVALDQMKQVNGTLRHVIDMGPNRWEMK